MTDRKEEELKLCPFCEVQLEEWESTGPGRLYAHPENGCFLSDYCVHPVDRTPWNRRAPDITTLQTEVTELRDGMEKIEKIISTNLYHQQEKIEDALSIARALLSPDTNEPKDKDMKGFIDFSRPPSHAYREGWTNFEAGQSGPNMNPDDSVAFEEFEAGWADAKILSETVAKWGSALTTVTGEDK